MTEKLTTTILPLLGVLLGASLQYFFSRSAESRKQLRLLRSQAYSDYLRIVAKLAHLSSKDHAKRAELFADVADAKARICIYGAPAVISKLAAFERAGASLNSEGAVETFMELCQEMRRESPEGAAAIQNDLRLVLFGSRRFEE